LPFLKTFVPFLQHTCKTLKSESVAKLFSNEKPTKQIKNEHGQHIDGPFMKKHKKYDIEYMLNQPFQSFPVISYCVSVKCVIFSGVRILHK
jgi:hypothetical protein